MPLNLRAKRWHRKSRAGCKACKERKVKCDERRPVCERCAVHFEIVVECDYGQFDDPQGEQLSNTRALDTTTLSSLLCPRPEASPEGKESIPVDIATSIPDPFETYPPTAEPDVHYLLQLFFASTISKVFPSCPSNRETNQIWQCYAPMINKDHLLFHVALLLSASDMERDLPPARRLRCNRIEPHCLQLLQERINEPVSQSASDETLAAVSGLVAFDQVDGRCSSLGIHLEGLRHIMRVRGGLDPVRISNATVANIVLWTFLTVDDDTLTGGEYDDEPIPLPAWFFETMEQDLTPPLLDLESLGIGPRLIEIVRNIRALFLHCPGPGCSASIGECQISTTFLTTNLEAIIFLAAPDPPTGTAAMLSNAFQHALVIYLFAAFEGFHPDPINLINSAQSHLLTVLRPLMKRGMSNTLLLWILVVGGAYLKSSSRTERRWYVGNLEEMCQKMGVQTWMDLKTALRCVIFNQKRDEKRHRQMWIAVAARSGLSS